MRGFLSELASAFVGLRRSAGFTVLTGSILTVGLGLTFYMFGAINGFILRPLPFPQPDRLFHVEYAERTGDNDSIEVPIADFVELTRNGAGFSELEAFHVGTINLSGDGDAERYDGAFASAGLLHALGVMPQLGRGFGPEDVRPGAAPVALLSDILWRHRFGGDAAVVGRTLRANGREATIVGVLPPGFRFPYHEDVWLPIDFEAARRSPATASTLEVVARSAEGESAEAARQRVDAFLAVARKADPKRPDWKASIKPLGDEYVDATTQRLLLAMFASVVLVLLIACANVANLLLARGLVRRRELALRAALGAGRARLVGHVVAQILAVTTIATGLGLALGDWGGKLTMDTVRASGENIPSWITTSLDARSAAFAIVVALVTTLAAGLWPALRSSGISVAAALQKGGRGSTGLPMGRASRVLVVIQLALGTALAVCALLTARGVQELDRVPLGIRTEPFLTGRLGLFEGAYPDEPSRLAFLERLEERLRRLPGVEAVTLTTSLPATFVGFTEMALEGAASTGTATFAAQVAVSPSYFDTFEIPLVAGRGLAASDAGEAAAVTVVNRRFVERYADGRDPLGRRIQLGDAESGRWVTIVGVVPDVQQDEPDAQSFAPTVYVPLTQQAPRFISVALRTAGPPSALSEPFRRAVAELDPDLPVYWLRTLDEWVERGRFDGRLNASLFGIFAFSGLALAAVGLYAVLAYTVAQRTSEIAVRKTLGAQDREIVRLLLAGSLRQIAVALPIGGVLALGVAFAIRGEFFGVTLADPVAWSSVPVVLGAVTLLASWLPALRALRVQPAEALRQE